MTLRVRLDPEHAVPPLRAMPPDPRRRMRAALAALATDPSGRENGLDVKRLNTPGDPPAYRLGIGAWRAGFLVRHDTLDVVHVFHRSEGYGWLDRLYPM